MNFDRIILLLLVGTLGACTHSKKKHASTDEHEFQLIKQVDTLEHRVKELKDQNVVLEQRVKAAEPTDQEAYSGDQALYVTGLNAYWSRDLGKLVRLKNMMLKTYADSMQADKLVFLTAKLQFSEGDMVESLKNLNDLATRYPKSGEISSALYLKGLIYRRLNLNEQAQDVFQKLIKSYGGSRSGQEAKIQLKELNKRVSSR